MLKVESCKRRGKKQVMSEGILPLGSWCLNDSIGDSHEHENEMRLWWWWWWKWLMRPSVAPHCQCLPLTNPFCAVSYFPLFLRNQPNNRAPLSFAPNLQIVEHSAMEPLSASKFKPLKIIPNNNHPISKLLHFATRQSRTKQPKQCQI